MHIFLTGFMGVGKTTIGLQLSELLELDFIDLDQEIINQTGLSISEIFNNNGAQHRYTLERTFARRSSLRTRPPGARRQVSAVPL